jgi:hypothetical protein
MAGATNECPKGREKLGVPDEGVVEVLNDETSHGGCFGKRLLSAVVAILTLELRTAIQAMGIGQIGELSLRFGRFYALIHLFHCSMGLKLVQHIVLLSGKDTLIFRKAQITLSYILIYIRMGK